MSANTSNNTSNTNTENSEGRFRNTLMGDNGVRVQIRGVNTRDNCDSMRVTMKSSTALDALNISDDEKVRIIIDPESNEIRIKPLQPRE